MTYKSWEMGNIFNKSPPAKKRPLSTRLVETPPAWEPNRSAPLPLENHLNRKHEWGSSSYNLLDLQGGTVYFNQNSLPSSRRWSTASHDTIPVDVSPGSRSPIKNPKVSPTKRSKSEDKFSHFRNLTNHRIKTTSSPPSSDHLKMNHEKQSASKRHSPVKHLSPKKMRAGSMPASPISSSKMKPSQPTQKRRVSDVSTITLSSDEKNNNFFKPIQPKPSEASATGSDGPLKKSGRSQKGGQTSKTGKIHPDSSQRNSVVKRLSQNNTNSSLGREFTGLKSIRSATQSVQSAKSNFEVRTKVEKFDDKKQSLALAGLARMEPLQHSFKDPKWGSPKAGFEKAKNQLESSEWEDTVDGIVGIVALTKKAPELLLADLKNVIRLMTKALKNLRSQVCRAAGQAFSELYVHLGKSMELDLDKVVTILLQKSADTNRFIRDAASEALTAMAGNVTVYRALVAVSDGGLHHKSVVVRGEVARIFDLIVTQMTAERVFGSSSDLQGRILSDGADLLTDGSLEVRIHAKQMFSELMCHSRFESSLKEHVKETQLKQIQKSLDAIQLSRK